MEDTKGLPTSAQASSPELPLDTPSKRGRVQLKAPQIIKASEWMKANEARVVAATDGEIAFELGLVLNMGVTENNVAMLRKATGLLPKAQEDVNSDDIGTLARALAYLLDGDVTSSGELIAAVDRIACSRGH